MKKLKVCLDERSVEILNHAQHIGKNRSECIREAIFLWGIQRDLVNGVFKARRGRPAKVGEQ